MTGEGKVVKIENGKTYVEIRRESACGKRCESCNACSNPTYVAEVQNPINATVGDHVELTLASGRVLGAAFALYLAPVLLLFAVCFGVYAFASAYAPAYPAELTAAAAAIVVALWVMCLRVLNKRITLKSVITAVIHPGKEDCQ